MKESFKNILFGYVLEPCIEIWWLYKICSNFLNKKLPLFLKSHWICDQNIQKKFYRAYFCSPPPPPPPPPKKKKAAEQQVQAKTLLLIWKMYKGIRKKGEFKGCQVTKRLQFQKAWSPLMWVLGNNRNGRSRSFHVAEYKRILLWRFGWYADVAPQPATYW
jgi:hypothetical protein